MIKNPGRRAFIKKNLILLSGIPLYGCGGGGSGGSSPTNTVTAPPPTTTTPPPLELPSFVTQPSNITVNPGESATFQALANGSEPLSYQWQRNGSNIDGATSLSYTTQLAALGDDAQFSVTVTNDAGTVSSQEAQLTVVAAPSTSAITADSTSITIDSTLVTVDTA